jgi:hypothetical protein
LPLGVIRGFERLFELLVRGCVALAPSHCGVLTYASFPGSSRALPRAFLVSLRYPKRPLFHPLSTRRPSVVCTKPLTPWERRPRRDFSPAHSPRFMPLPLPLHADARGARALIRWERLSSRDLSGGYPARKDIAAGTPLPQGKSRGCSPGDGVNGGAAARSGMTACEAQGQGANATPGLAFRQVFVKQVSGRQTRRAVFWDAQHTGEYVSNHKSAAQRRITA